MVKKRTPSRKSAPKSKGAKKSARPSRTAGSRKAKPSGRVDFRGVKRDLKARIAMLEGKHKTDEARAMAVDPQSLETLSKLRQLDSLMTDLCQPSMVIGS